MAKRGRPKKKAIDKRTERFEMRMSPREMDLLRAAAEKSGERFGVWVRARLLDAAGRR